VRPSGAGVRAPARRRRADRSACFVGTLGSASPGPATYLPPMPQRPRRQGAGVATSAFASGSSRLLSMTAPSWGERAAELGHAPTYGQPAPRPSPDRTGSAAPRISGAGAPGTGGSVPAQRFPEPRGWEDPSLMRERLGIGAGPGAGKAGPIGPGSYEVAPGSTGFGRARFSKRANPTNAWIG
jgi:hypothetical protein